MKDKIFETICGVTVTLAAIGIGWLALIALDRLMKCWGLL